MRIDGFVLRTNKYMVLAPINKCKSCLYCVTTKHKAINIQLCEITREYLPLASFEVSEACPFNKYEVRDEEK